MKTHIVIHCTATPEGKEVSVATLDSWHKARNFEPYVDPTTKKKVYAGYHLLVHLDGSYDRIRPNDARGQHCPQQNMNNCGIAICYVGGVAKDGKTPKDTRTLAQKSTIRSLVETLKKKYPNLKVIGHGEVKGVAKACPSFSVKQEFK